MDESRSILTGLAAVRHLRVIPQVLAPIPVIRYEKFLIVVFLRPPGSSMKFNGSGSGYHFVGVPETLQQVFQRRFCRPAKYGRCPDLAGQPLSSIPYDAPSF